ELDGLDAGEVVGISGGELISEVVSIANSSGYYDKHLGQPIYEEITVELESSGHDHMLAWMKASFDNKHSRKDGSIVEGDDDAQGAGAPMRISNLSFAVGPGAAAGWLSWYRDFVIRGDNAQGKEKAGTLHYLTESGTVLLGFDFHGLGIFKAKAEQGGQVGPLQ